MPQQLFIFIQLEFPWALGPPDGRYLLRGRVDGGAEHVVVLNTLGARHAAIGRAPDAAARRPSFLERRRPRGPGREATADPAAVLTTRVTVIDPVPLSAEQQARAWLEELDREHESRAAVAVVNRVLHLHRIAAADPYTHEVSPAQALVIRAGWGEGEQVADGRWLHARELPWTPRRRRAAGTRRVIADRSAALRPLERLAALLGARSASLLCEELALRARLDLDHGRVRHAALELDRAYSAAIPELRAEARQDLTLRIAELEQLRPGVAAQADAALPDEAASSAAQPDEEIVRHALERLEAVMRARTAAGFSLKR
ncbi:MAG: hypothetical protein JWL67_1169 [Solirubrobacterales bacterium]|jgi:hypothetical protein|nr:hypothetical protein [Solirubrobacterales bacterium]